MSILGRDKHSQMPKPWLEFWIGMFGVNIWIYFLSGMHAVCVWFYCLRLQVMWTWPAMFFFFFLQYICPCLTQFCLLSVPVSESWSRSKGRCSLIGQHSTPSSVPLLQSVPPLSRQQQVNGQQQHPLGFGQVSSGLSFSLYNVWGIMLELTAS